MSTHASTTVTVVLAAATLAACGSSSKKTIPKAQLISKGDAICTRLEAGIGPGPNINPAKATPAQLKSLAPFLTKNANVVKAEVDQVGALGTPDKDAAEFKQILADGRTVANEFQAAATASAAGDRKAFLAAFTVLMNTPSRGKQFGFKKCDVQS
jgi:hypothetical protein